jgi:hypothetical protein
MNHSNNYMGERLRPLAMQKSDLAAQYFPDSLPKTAVRHLMRWLELCKPLMEQLIESGYDKHQKMFTSRQVASIYEFLGEP